MSTTFDPKDPDDVVYGSHLNESGITPLGYKILLELPTPADISRAKASGLVIPERVEDQYTQAAVVARVVQVGSGAYRDPARFPDGPWVKAGDYVAMSPYNGTRLRSTLTNKDYRMVNDDTLDAVVPSPDFVERG